MSKRIVSLLMLLALASALLAACGTPTPPTTTTQTTGAEAGATTAEATVAEAEATPETTVAETATAAETTAAETATAGEMMAETATAGETATEVGMTAETATAGETATTGATAVAMALPNVSALNLPPIKIAMQGPLSGPQAAFGTAIRNGAQLAVEQLAPQLGLQIELVPRDDQATDAVGAANAREIVADQDTLCVVGHYNSSVALASLPA